MADQRAPGSPDGRAEGSAEHRRGFVGPFTGRRLALAVALVAGVALALVLATSPLAPGGIATPGPLPTQYAIGSGGEGLHVGERASELLVRAADGADAPLHDLDGRPVRLADLRGRPVWLSFWASWCPPCQAETPVLRDAFARYAPAGLALVAISVQEPADDVRAYAEEYGLRYTVAADLSGDLFRRYRVHGLPTQLFIDGDGVIRAMVQGPMTAETVATSLRTIGLEPPAVTPTPAP